MMAEGEHGNKMVASDQETGQILQVTIFKEQFATNSRLRTDNTGAGAMKSFLRQWTSLNSIERNLTDHRICKKSSLNKS